MKNILAASSVQWGVVSRNDLEKTCTATTVIIETRLITAPALKSLYIICAVPVPS